MFLLSCSIYQNLYNRSKIELLWTDVEQIRAKNGEIFV